MIFYSNFLSTIQSDNWIQNVNKLRLSIIYSIRITLYPILISKKRLISLLFITYFVEYKKSNNNYVFLIETQSFITNKLLHNNNNLVCILIKRMQSQQIKMVAFKRLDTKNPDPAPNQLKLFQTNSYLFNVLLYTTSQSQKTNNRINIKQIQKHILSNYQQQIQLMKFHEQKSIIYAIRSIFSKNHKLTFCITDKPLPKQIQDLQKQTQDHTELISLFNKLKFIILLEEKSQIQRIQQINFQLENIVMITTKQKQVTSYIDNQVQKIQKQRPNVSICSSINSEDQKIYEQQLNVVASNIQPPASIKTNKKKEFKTLQVVLNDTPGVGTYNI